MMAACVSTSVVSGVTVFVPSSGIPDSCSAVLLSGTEYTGFTGLLSGFGWDVSAFEVAVGGALGMFAVGFGIGLIIQNLRRLRTP